MTLSTARMFAFICSLICAIGSPALAQSKHGSRDYGARAPSKSEQRHGSARLKNKGREPASPGSKSQGRGERRIEQVRKGRR